MQKLRNVVGIVRRLVQQLDVPAVGQHTARVLVVQDRANVLGNGSQDCAPLAGTAGKLEVVVRAGAVAQKQLELIGDDPGTPPQHAVAGDAVPDLVQHRHHTDGLHTFAQLYGVKAQAVVAHVHVGLVGKQVHGAVHIQTQRPRHGVGGFALQQQIFVKIVQGGHLLAFGVQ